MQSDSTHTMITRNRARDQSVTDKPSSPTTRSQTQVQPATVKPVLSTVKPVLSTVKPVLSTVKPSSPTTRSQTQVKPATVKPIQSATKLPLSSSSVVQEPRMVTRSSNNSPRYDVDIDFDEASEAWRANKKSIGNGMFKYVGMRTRSKM
jgi:hypothetical protein